MKILLIYESTEDLGFLKGQLKAVPELGLKARPLEDTGALVRFLEEEEPPDLILLSCCRPDGAGSELLKELHQELREPPPLILIAAAGDHKTAVEVMKSGAMDYLLMEDLNPEILKRSVFSALERRRLQGQLAEANRTIREMAFTDALTGLFNRHFFNESLKREYENALRYNYPLSCIMIDLDFFKETNDRFGHLIGDAALRQVAETIREMVRGGDVPARYGGDEFVILLPHTPSSGAMILAQRIQAQLRSTPLRDIRTQEVCLTASFGVASLMPGSFYSKEDLLNQADDALYRAKRGGKNRISRWTADGQEEAGGDTGTYGNMLEYYKRSLQRLQLQVKASYIELCETLVKAIESRDPLVVDFSKKVMGLSVSTAMQMGLPADEVEIIKNAALLHDIGMIGIPDTILLKKEPLTPEEVRCIQRHPAIGMEMLIHVSFLDRERQIILQHHEWWNGEGYPSGIRGERIPLGARILAVADAFVAMCGERSHRKAMKCREALDQILARKGTQFDPSVVEAFLPALERARNASGVPAPAG